MQIVQINALIIPITSGLQEPPKFEAAGKKFVVG